MNYHHLVTFKENPVLMTVITTCKNRYLRFAGVDRIVCIELGKSNLIPY